MRPRGPNEKIDRDRGGERRRDQRQQRRARRAAGAPRGEPARATVNANRNPSSVPQTPTSAASSRLLQKRRADCSGSVRRAANARPSVNAPSSKNARASSIDERIDDEQQRAAAHDARQADRCTRRDRPAIREARDRAERRAAAIVTAAGVEHFGHPAIDDALAVRARLCRRRSGRSWRPSAPRRGSARSPPSGCAGTKLILCWRELGLHGRARRPVDQLLAALGDSSRP